MNKSFVNAVIEEIKSQPKEKKDDYETISVRPGLKIASMIEVFQTLSNKKVSSMFTDGITSELYKYCLSDEHNVFVINEVCHKLNSDEKQKGLDQLSGDDCLSLLNSNGAVSFKAVTKSEYHPGRASYWQTEKQVNRSKSYYIVSDPNSPLKGKKVSLSKEFPGPEYVVEYRGKFYVVEAIEEITG